jgi:hypothetical protein
MKGEKENDNEEESLYRVSDHKFLHEFKDGRKIKDVCREYDISEETYFNVNYIDFVS